MTTFHDDMKAQQLAWRRKHLQGFDGQGRWNNKSYDHILPRKHREQNLWQGIRAGGRFPLAPYLVAKQIQAHTGRDNLLSSWTLCANFYYPFGQDPVGLALLAGFLKDQVDSSITAVSSVELEYANPQAELQPEALLGESGGERGAGQTSPDLAFLVNVEGGGEGVVLTEVKFTEHNFYACSARKGLSQAEKDATCHDLAALRKDPAGLCAQHTIKGRRYWDQLATHCFDWNEAESSLRWCPAATAGYQLFRQHALAEGLAWESDFKLVVSALAYDERNGGLPGARSGLVQSIRRTGVPDIRSDWAPLFDGDAKFKVFAHQEWVKWVQDHPDERPSWCDGEDGWLSYVTERYTL